MDFFIETSPFTSHFPSHTLLMLVANLIKLEIHRSWIDLTLGNPITPKSMVAATVSELGETFMAFAYVWFCLCRNRLLTGNNWLTYEKSGTTRELNSSVATKGGSLTAAATATWILALVETRSSGIGSLLSPCSTSDCMSDGWILSQF